MTILDGATGEALLSSPIETGAAHPWRSATDPLRVRVDGYGNDLALFVSSLTEADRMEVAPECSGQQQGREEENCSSQYSSFKVSGQLWQPQHRLNAFSSQLNPAKVPIYDSFSKSVASKNWVNATEKALEYVEDHPRLWSLFNYFEDGDESRLKSKV